MPKMTFYEGQTATNHQTGQKLVYRGGKWFPMGQDGAAALPAKPVMQDAPQDREDLVNQRNKADQALRTATQAERFVKLNQDVTTGGLTSIPMGFGMFGPSLRDVGAVIAQNPKYQEMKSISASVAPGLRPPGSGSSSDKDTALYMQSFPNVKNLGTANQAIAERYKQDAVREKARSAFMDTWYGHHGSLLGADQAFDKFWTGYQATHRGGGKDRPSLDSIFGK